MINVFLPIEITFALNHLPLHHACTFSPLMKSDTSKPVSIVASSGSNTAGTGGSWNAPNTGGKPAPASACAHKNKQLPVGCDEE